MSRGLAPDYTHEDAIKRAEKFFPSKDDFDRMLYHSPDKMKAIVCDKPTFPYSREQVEDMTKEEYRKAFAKWENDRYGPPKIDDSSLDAMYQKFREWNLKCVNDMYEDEMEHLDWLCDWIAKGKVRNMDMESCGEYHTEGFYFNAAKRLVIYSGR